MQANEGFSQVVGIFNPRNKLILTILILIEVTFIAHLKPKLFSIISREIFSHISTEETRYVIMIKSAQWRLAGKAIMPES